MSKDDNAQMYQMLSVLFLTLSKGEQVQQCIREVLTSHPFFSPMALFKHLAKNGTVIKKEHLIQFLEDNKEQAEEAEVKIIMEIEPGKKCWQYRDFLQFVYPFNSAVLREINNLHLKRYPKLQKYGAPQSAQTAFLLLLKQQIGLIRKLETQKSDSLQRIPKQKLKKVFLSIKKAGEKQPSHCENDNTRITSLELRNFMRAFVSVEDSHFLYLSRKLGLKNGYVLIEHLQKFIKTVKKTPKKGNHQKNQKPTPKEIFVPQEEDQNEFDEKKYKQNILQELAKDVSEKEIKRNLYNLQYQEPQEKKLTSNYQKPSESVTRREEKTLTNRPQPVSDNYFMEPAKKETVRNGLSPKDLLIQFVTIFIPVSRRLEELKLKLTHHRLDYFKLFKIIDRRGRGVAGAEDLLEYYRWAGGKIQYTPKDFELLIERYAQSDEPWLTLTEFCQMVRTEDKESTNRPPPTLNDEVHDLVTKIMEISLESELEILEIRHQFRRQESKYLFNLINREQTGFINYQQLKKFLAGAGLHLNMHDLMAVLKRLDRSRNGVVVQHEFVSYFRTPEQF